MVRRTGAFVLLTLFQHARSARLGEEPASPQPSQQAVVSASPSLIVQDVASADFVGGDAAPQSKKREGAASASSALGGQTAGRVVQGSESSAQQQVASGDAPCGCEGGGGGGAGGGGGGGLGGGLSAPPQSVSSILGVQPVAIPNDPLMEIHCKTVAMMAQVDHLRGRLAAVRERKKGGTDSKKDSSSDDEKDDKKKDDKKDKKDKKEKEDSS
eukprot:TRINITY_DN7448_c0_g1_i1.p1 TRINITY_DN7448_c0_g1~~TRINITY_DN7448_c0_g1_i1.p1  ORF type:complete len:213 (+),score=64.77 TRINITY_DN7448_c0_g1_i1:78-716(+)